MAINQCVLGVNIFSISPTWGIEMLERGTCRATFTYGKHMFKIQSENLAFST